MAGEAIRFNASLNTAGFDSGAARLQQVAAQTSGTVSASFASMGASIAGVIAPFVGLYAAIDSVKSALDLGGRMNDLSKTTGETAGNLAILERAFDNAGVGGEKMGIAIASMSNFMTDFQAGSTAASATMDRLGLSMADLAGKSPIEQMRVFMAAIADIEDPSLRTAMAMDVFKKAGKEIVPLASDFAGELANAKGELGSLPGILDENAASLDDLGDKLTNSVGSKLTELAVGLAAGTTGANDFVTALSKIDAAGLGENIGNALRNMFAAPMESAKALGYTLETGAKVAGNALINAIVYAADYWGSVFSSSDYFTGIGLKLQAGMLEAVNAFNKVLAYGIDYIVLRPLASLPGMIGEPFRQALSWVQDIEKSLSAASEANWATWKRADKLQSDAFNKAASAGEILSKDWLNVAESADKAAKSMLEAEAAGAGLKDSSAAVSENFATGSAALSKALEEMRGFDLGGGKDDPFKLPYPGSENFPTSAGPGAPEVVGGGDGGGGAAGGGGGGRGGGGGGGRGGGGGGSDEEKTFNQRVGELRGKARAEPALQRAADYAAAGMYDSAIRAEDRAKRAFDRAMDSAAVKDQAARYTFDDRPAGNAGEAFDAFKKSMGLYYKDVLKDQLKDLGEEYDKTKSELENFTKKLKEQARAEKEKEKDQKTTSDQGGPAGGGGGGGGGGGASDTKDGADNGGDGPEGKLDTIIKLMTERLPIRVLAA